MKSNSILQELGVIGWGGITEDLILAGVLTGDSVLLIGSSGSAKTFFCYKLASALDVRFQKIDASKCEFEDLVGIFSPRALAEGRFEYIKTPLSVSDKEFLLIDEINRAKPEIQNKLLELIYNREIMGEKTNVKWVFGAMNSGEEYTGLEPLDPAFAGRFGLILPVPDMAQMNPDDVKKIITSEGDNDALALKFWHSDKNKVYKNSLNPAIIELLRKAAGEYEKISEEFCEEIKDYLSCFTRICHKEMHVSIDGRRASFMRRNVLSYIAIRKTKTGKNFDKEDIFRTMREVLPYSFPDAAWGRPVPNLKLESAFLLTEKMLANKSVYFKMIFSDSVIERIKIAIAENLDEFAKRKFINNILSDEKLESILAPLILSPFSLLSNSPFPLDVRVNILKKLREMIERFSSKDTDRIKIKRIKDLKLLTSETMRSRNKINTFIDAIVSNIAGEKNLNNNERIIMKRNAKAFLQEAKSKLQDIYTGLKNEKH